MTVGVLCPIFRLWDFTGHTYFLGGINSYFSSSLTNGPLHEKNVTLIAFAQSDQRICCAFLIF